VKSEKLRVKSCATAVLRELAQRGVMYEAGSHNKYISDACYMMNRYGVSENDCTAWALEKFADYQAEGNDVASIVRSCYQLTEEHGTMRPPRNTESRYASIRDIQDWLTKNNIRIRHNLITRKREISFNDNDNVNDNCRPDGWSTSALSSTFSFWKELEDKSVNSLYCRFCLDTGRQAKISDFYIIIESDFYPEYHPLKEYLESLPAWDGMTDHIDQLASRVRVTGCTQEMHNRYFKKWFVAMVAAWIVDGVTNHEILTYIGPQGIYKSTFMRLLLPPTLRGYFSARNFANRMTKDDRLELTEMGLIALEELDHMKIHELNQLKAITTDPTVNERAAYARYRERREHIASFCGTGNNARFLTDLTSNRRWLPFMVDCIDSPYDTPINYMGTYAQAYALWKQGFRYWFDDAENAELEEHNHNFEEPNLELELIQTYFRLPRENEVGEFYTASRIIETICVSIKTPLYPRNIAIWMNKLGYQQRRRDNMRGWNVILLTATDIKQCQQENARLSNIE
jgi:predicted P-loop ATPase